MTAQTNPWRLIVDDNLDGAHNMARDVAVLEAVSKREAPPTLRLYDWKPPCLTLGRHQELEAADLDFCRARGIDVVRRPTGGRALLHHLELTYAVMAPLGEGPIPRRLQDAYRTICSTLVRAIRALGIEAELTPGEVNLELPGPRTSVPCFEAPAGGEVVVRGRKLIGSAMRAHAGSILQHGAIVVGWDSRLQAGAMGLVDDSVLRSQVTTISDELGREPLRSELEAVLIRAVSEELGITLAEGVLTEEESVREQELAESFAVG